MEEKHARQGKGLCKGPEAEGSLTEDCNIQLGEEKDKRSQILQGPIGYGKGSGFLLFSVMGRLGGF